MPDTNRQPQPTEPAREDETSDDATIAALERLAAGEHGPSDDSPPARDRRRDRQPAKIDLWARRIG